MAGTTTRRRGRPPAEPTGGKRHNVTVVMADPIRRAIGEAAERNGRSLSSEIDFRLGVSLALEKDAPSPATRAMLDLVRLAATAVRLEFGHDWTGSADAASALAGAIDLLVRSSSPPLPENERLEASNEEFEALTARLSELRDEVDTGDERGLREMQKVMLELMKHLAVRESIMAIDRKRRLRGAKLAADVMSPFAALADPEVAQGGWLKSET
jgi:hypothetical protein